MTDADQCASHEGESGAQPTSRPPSVDYIKIGGRCYPGQHYRRCATCTSPFRFDLEMQIVLGASYPDACERVAAAQVPETSLRRHVERKHLDLDRESVEAFQRAHVEKGAEAAEPGSPSGHVLDTQEPSP
jgi:hypothetical protein